jgi:hypothetical protein
LEDLNLSRCEALTTLQSLAGSTALKTVNLSYCKRLRTCPIAKD